MKKLIIVSLFVLLTIFFTNPAYSQSNEDSKLEKSIAEYCHENWRKAPDMCSEYIPDGYYDQTAKKILSQNDQQKIQQFQSDFQNKICPPGTEKKASGLNVVCLSTSSSQTTQTPNFNFDIGNDSNIQYYVIGFVVILVILIVIIKAASRSENKTSDNLQYTLDSDFKNLSGDEFEEIVGKLYNRKGYRVTKTPIGPDQGVDLIARKGSEKIVIQAKNWKNNVSNTDILKTAGARQMQKANSAVVVTSSKFTKSAIEALRHTPKIKGIDIDELKKEFYKNFRK